MLDEIVGDLLRQPRDLTQQAIAAGRDVLAQVTGPVQANRCSYRSQIEQLVGAEGGQQVSARRIGATSGRSTGIGSHGRAAAGLALRRS